MNQVVDSAVLRFSKAVTHFSPGSYTSRPTQQTSLSNVFMSGGALTTLSPPYAHICLPAIIHPDRASEV